MKRTLLFLGIALGITAGVLSLYRSAFEPLDPSYGGEDLSFDVLKGESLNSVLYRLEEENLIKGSFPYKISNKLKPLPDVRPGKYRLSPRMTGWEILGLLQKGKEEEQWITIPEGLTLREVGLRLEEAGFFSAQTFQEAAWNQALLSELGLPPQATNAEGYLFPDTYLIPTDYSPQRVISLMVERFHEVLQEIYPLYKEQLNPQKLQEKIILASIIEKEYRASEEAPLMASVFLNRLKIRMPLQSCATVVYVITEVEGRPRPNRIWNKDLKLPSPYNTYYVNTMPPGAIASPGRVALEAAFKPAQTDYLYFVVKDRAKGTHTFSRTLSDHNKAREDYISGFLG